MNLFDRFRKKLIEIVCPACSGVQTEPALAFSTYCRQCGEHLKIVKGLAVSHDGPRLSGLASVKVLSDASENPNPEPAPAPKKERRKGKKKRSRGVGDPQDSRPLSEAPTASPEFLEEPEVIHPIRARPASVAEVFGLAPCSDDSEEDICDVETTLPFLNPTGEDATTDFHRNAELAEGSMGALIGDLVEQEEKRNLANQSATGKPAADPLPVSTPAATSKTKIKVRCFRCHHRQWVSKFAESTQCGRCNTYISLLDFEIRQATDRVIRTRGNITVHRKGSLIGTETACRDLVAMGPVTTRLDCSGEARFRFSSSVSGHLYCENLIIEKGIIVEFSEGVYTENAQIHGTLRGKVFSSGTVSISRTGILDGDVTARVVDFSDGGTLTGKLTIDEDNKIELPVIRGYDPSIID